MRKPQSYAFLIFVFWPLLFFVMQDMSVIPSPVGYILFGAIFTCFNGLLYGFTRAVEWSSTHRWSFALLAISLTLYSASGAFYSVWVVSCHAFGEGCI